MKTLKKIPDLPPPLKLNLAVGHPVWYFDVNRRVYRKLTAKEKKSEMKYSRGGPIWKEHWVEIQIIGETRVSWILGSNGRELLKVCKKTLESRAQGDFGIHHVCFSMEEINRAAWVQDHQYAIKEILTRGIQPYEVWKAVAEAIDYQPKGDGHE